MDFVIVIRVVSVLSNDECACLHKLVCGCPIHRNMHKLHIRGYKRIMISQWSRQLYEHNLQFSVVRTEGRIIEPHINSHRCVF